MPVADWNGFKGKAKRIEDIDLPRIGKRIKVGEDEIHAFLDVECAGSGFDSQGRPKMLFEPHRFYKNLPSGAQLNAAVKQGLAYPKWGTKPYPKDSYPRLIKAMAINEEAALKSCSWGLGQVMGENYRLAEFNSVRDMVRAMMDDEDNHLEASIAFIDNTNLDDELRSHNWAAFARGYNGPGYKKNKYDVKLRTAFNKWAKIKDTPYHGEEDDEPVTPRGILHVPDRIAEEASEVEEVEETPEVIVVGEAEPAPAKRGGGLVGLIEKIIPTSARTSSAPTTDLKKVEAHQKYDKNTVLFVQTQLKVAGFTEVGELDGVMGPNTETAILGYRNLVELPIKKTIDKDLLNSLKNPVKKPISAARANAGMEKIMDSPGVRGSILMKGLGGLLGIGGGATTIGEVLGKAEEAADNVNRFGVLVDGFRESIPWLIITVVGIVICYFGYKIGRHLLEGYRTRHHV